jgi:hypothetical protein
VVVRAGTGSSPDAHEAQAAALHHPNIVPAFEIGEHETQPFFTTRFVPRRQTIANWAAQVARAVAYAHGHSEPCSA